MSRGCVSVPRVVNPPLPMLTLLRGLVSRAAWLALSFVLVLLILSVADGIVPMARRSVQEARAMQALAGSLEANRQAFSDAATRQGQLATHDAALIKQFGTRELDNAEAALERRKREVQARILTRAGRLKAALTGHGNRILASYRAELVEVPLLDGLLQAAGQRRIDLGKIASRRNRLNGLSGRIAAYNQQAEQLRASRTGLEQQRRALQAMPRASTCSRHDWWVWCADYRKKQQALLTKEGKYKAEVGALQGSRAKLNVAANALRFGQQGRSQVLAARDATATVLAAYRSDTNAYAGQAQTYAWNRTADAFRRNGSTACWIVVGAATALFLRRWLAFYLLAPLAGRAAPMRLGTSGPSIATSASHHTIGVAIDRSTELLVKAEVRATAANVVSTDKLLLGWWRLLTDLAAGTTGLQCLRSDRAETISLAATDPAGELMLVDVPAGASLALDSGALAGLLGKRDQPPRIKRPWRLGGLVAWMRGSWRFVVFHGPCSLIVEGRRGVVVCYAGEGRRNDRRLTLGFETGAALSAVRTGSFRRYRRGEALLLDDRFTGDGCFLYEQRATGAAGSNVIARGLAGLGDAAAKTVGW